MFGERRRDAVRRRIVEESGMTMTVESAARPNPMRMESSYECREFTDSDEAEIGEGRSARGRGVKSSFSVCGCQVLLEEPAIGLWASEAATKYGVTAADALELLAYALFLDGEK
jgi:hypothetical protein